MTTTPTLTREKIAAIFFDLFVEVNMRGGDMTEEHLTQLAIDASVQIKKMMDGSICFFCEVGITENDRDDHIWKQVASWVGGLHKDGATLREDTGARAHKACIDKIRAGQAVDQPSLEDILFSSTNHPSGGSLPAPPRMQGNQYLLDFEV